MTNHFLATLRDIVLRLCRTFGFEDCMSTPAEEVQDTGNAPLAPEGEERTESSIWDLTERRRKFRANIRARYHDKSSWTEHCNSLDPEEVRRNQESFFGHWNFGMATRLGRVEKTCECRLCNSSNFEKELRFGRCAANVFDLEVAPDFKFEEPVGGACSHPICSEHETCQVFRPDGNSPRRISEADFVVENSGLRTIISRNPVNRLAPTTPTTPTAKNIYDKPTSGPSDRRKELDRYRRITMGPHSMDGAPRSPDLQVNTDIQTEREPQIDSAVADRVSGSDKDGDEKPCDGDERVATESRELEAQATRGTEDSQTESKSDVPNQHRLQINSTTSIDVANIEKPDCEEKPSECDEQPTTDGQSEEGQTTEEPENGADASDEVVAGGEGDEPGAGSGLELFYSVYFH